MNQANTKTIFQIFYAVLFFSTFGRYFHQAFKPMRPPGEFVSLLSWVPYEHFFTFKVLVGFIGLISTFLCIIFPHLRTLRILSCLSLLFSVGLNSSYGKIIHGYYGFFFTSLALACLSNKHFKNTQSYEALTIAQFSSVLCYGMAGLWKVRYIPETFQKSGFQGLFESLGNSIAFEHVIYGRTPSAISAFFIEATPITGIMYFGLVLLQTFAPLVVLFRQTHLIFGIFIILFHVLSEIILRIAFRPQLYLMIVFFLVPSILDFWQKRKARSY